jgi:serine/threonine protein kinase/CHASE2 domain-containing sensor protein
MTDRPPTTISLQQTSFKRGDRLGDITLLEYIGRGGEGQIWSGLDNRRKRIVALKIAALLGQTEPNLNQVSHEFERQFHLIASLNHANVLPLYEFSSSDSHFYFVMRYTPLGSLADLLKKRPLTLEETLHCTAQIALTLDYLHSRGVVHRDLKPSNTLLGSNEQIYLADFGLAKRLSEETLALHTGRGTGPYAPYEQHTLAKLTPKADIYSLGIVIYEMLAGKLPWDGTTNLALQQYHDAGELPDIHEIRTDLPAAITHALRRLTAFDLNQRPGSALEAFQLLAAASDGNAFHQAADFYSVPPILPEDLVEANNAQALWQRLQAETADPLHVSLTHLAFLDSAYSKEDIEGLVRDEALRSFMLAGTIYHDYHLSYWRRQVTDPQARLQICERILGVEDSAVANRALELLASLQNTAGITLSDRLLNHLIDLFTFGIAFGTDTAARSRAYDILATAVQERQGWRPTGYTPEGDEKLAWLALSNGTAAGRAARLIGRAGSETAVQTILEKRDEVEPDRFLNLLQEIQAAAGTLPAVVPFNLRLRLRLSSLQEQFLEDGAGFSWSRGLLGLFAGILFSIFMLGGLLSPMDARMRDGLLTPYPVSNILTIVAVDNASLDFYGRWDEWPRSLHADLIERLQAAGAKVIVFDILFSSETANDAPLLNALRAADNIILSVSGEDEAYRTNPGKLHYETGVIPEADFMEAAAAGHTNILNDPDGYVRHVPTTITIGNQSYESLAIRTLELFLGVEEQPIPEPRNGFLPAVGRQIPVDEYGAMRLYYAGPPARPGYTTFPVVSYLDVIQGDAGPDLFRDKIVLVGVTATAIPDRYSTPVSQGRLMYGVEILANTIEAIWSNKFITRPGEGVRIVILLLLGVLTGLLCARPFSGLILAAAVGAIYFLFTSWLFDTRGVMLDILLPFLTIAAGYVAVTTFRYAVETRRRRVLVFPS